MNPDKWFLWKLLGAADAIYVIDHPLFDYRVHDAGQGPQEQRSGALKFLTDQYVSTFSLPDAVLARAGLDRDALAAAFVEQDIGAARLACPRQRSAPERAPQHHNDQTYPAQQTRANLKWFSPRAARQRRRESRARSDAGRASLDLTPVEAPLISRGWPSRYPTAPRIDERFVIARSRM